MDFLNANPIRYALTINPTIYTSCIEQFWTTVKAKSVNGEVQLQAIVDGKKIIITESIVRRDIQLEDAEDIDCLPNATIFEQLTLMGYEKVSQKLTFYKAFFSPQWKFLIHNVLQCLSAKTTAWNEFSSTMASAIILFLKKQLEGMSNHKRIYVTPSHTKKIFGNMRRVGKGFSGRETPLFQTMVVQHEEEMGEGSANPTDPYHTTTIIQPSTSQPQKKQKPRRPKRKDIEIPQSSGPTDNVADEAINEEMDESLERATTTATGLDAEQDRGNINKTQLKATPNEPSSIGTSSRSQETMRYTIAQTRPENVSKHSNDPLLAKGNTQVEDASKQGRKIDDIDKDIEITLIDETQGRYGDDLMFDKGILDNEEVFAGHDIDEKEINVAEKEVSTADLVTIADEVVTTASLTKTTTADDLTLAQTLIEIKSAKSKVKGVVIGEQSESTTRTRPQQLPSKDKAELEEEDRLVRQRKEEANIVSWDNVQAMIDVDYQMAQQMQAEEQEKLSIEEKSNLFVQLLETSNTLSVFNIFNSLSVF
ncbi:hypothetical protein Tco_0399629 [Tanacetum coccineum]